MSGPGFGFKWNPVAADIDWQLAQHRSLGSGVQTIGNALDTFANDTRKQNTDAVLAQMAQAQTQDELTAMKILGGVDPGNRTIDNMGILNAFASRDKFLETQDISDEQKLYNQKISLAKANNTPLEEVLTALRPDTTANTAGILADFATGKRAQAAAAQQQAFDNKIEEIKTASQVNLDNSTVKANEMKNAAAIVNSPDKTETKYYIDENGVTQSYVVTTPGLGSVLGGGAIPAQVKQAVFAGESGGDYDTLYGNSHKGNGKFSGTKLTEMTVNQALDFSKKGGAYAEWSKTQKGVKPGEYATPMGAYQIVGSTLKEAAKALGLKGNEKMTPELQDKLAEHIYATQGTDAWKGYKGPKMGGGGATKPATVQNKPPSTVGFSGDSYHAVQQEFAAFTEAQNAKETIGNMKSTAIEQQELTRFLREGKYVGSVTGALGNDNAQIYNTLMGEDRGIFKNLSAAEQKEALEYVSKANQANSGVLGSNISPMSMKNELYNFVSGKKLEKAAAQKQAAFTKMNELAVKLYNENKKDFPGLTLDAARKAVNPAMYAEFDKLRKGKGKQAPVSAKSNTAKKGVPYKKPSEPTLANTMQKWGTRDNPFN